MANLTIEEIEAQVEERDKRIQAIDAEFPGQRFSDEAREEWNRLNDEVDDLEDTLKELRARKGRVEERSDKPENVERTYEPPQTRRAGSVRGNEVFNLAALRRDYNDPVAEGAELRDRAKKANDMASFPHPDADQDHVRGHVERLIAADTENGDLSRYILTVGSPAYKRAFSKAWAGRPLNADDGEILQRALSLTGASGGFAVPFELDPTILPTSNGVVNPIRELARVIPITGDEWRGVTSTGITATYEAEATETTDNAPTLVQPTISTEKAQAFVPFSIEVGMDWNGLQQEMAVLLQDAKDTLEAAKFVTGTGTNEPFGVITGTTNTVNAGAGGTFTLANLYALVAALPPRYRPRAAFMGDLLIAQKIRQFETTGGSTSAVWVDGLQADMPGQLLGKPFYEASEMADVTTVGAKFLLFGDFSRYVIVERIGLQVELIPHLMGANRRPTGQRGLYAYWRNGAKVVDANAFRVLLGLA